MHTDNDPSLAFTGSTILLTVAVWWQMDHALAYGDHIYRPHWIAWFLVTSSLLLAVTIFVRLIQQLIVIRRQNITAIVPAAALFGAYLILERMFAVSAAAHTMGINLPMASLIIPAFINYAMPALASLSGGMAVLMLALRRPIPGAPVQRAQSTATAATPSNMDNEAAAETPASHWPAKTPRYTFANLHGNQELKDNLLQAARDWQDKGRNGILLSGPPGTGKSMSAEALAGELGIAFMDVTFGSMASRFINQTTERVVEIFRAAREQGPVLLFLDELDAVIADRSGGTGGYEEYKRMTTTFLTEAVNIRDADVLMVAATNYLESLDDAAIREGRFDFKIEVPLPDATARRFLIEHGLRKNGCQAESEVLDRLTRRWGGFNVPRIQMATSKACEMWRADHPSTESTEVPSLDYSDFYRALRAVQGRKAGAPEGAKRLADIFMEPDQKARLEGIAMQLSKVDDIERLGGTIPKGIVFFGPPGTGKTATAMALARACGWSFITRRGRDLMTSGAIDELREEASDLRPAIVFLDEADDILANREYSSYKSVTNELLTLMDGAGGMLHDVVWVAATNHIHNIDSAALRGGRFEQKIEFSAPSEPVLRALIEQWTQVHADVVDGDPEKWVAETTDLIAGQTPANAYSILQLANNMAVTASLTQGAERAITTRQVSDAVAEIIG